MTREEAISELETRYLTMSQCLNKEELHKANEAIDMAIEALEFLEKYDAVWYGIKCAGEHGQEVELHRYGRVYRIREVAT